MNADNLDLVEKLLGGGGAFRAAMDAKRTRENAIGELLRHKKLPKNAWDDQTIELFLQELSALDSNNFRSSVGVGEREGRIFSDLVVKRHFRMTHGIGRSGDLTAIQPKAIGSSLLNKLANALVLDAIRISGVKHCNACFVAPLATGMAICLCLQYLRRLRSNVSTLRITGQCKYVIWMRIDQKSCFKAILAAGLEPVIIEPKLVGDELITNIDATLDEVKRLGAENIICIVTTTSCFAPRVPDDVIAIGKLCQEYNIPHLINNAYGLQAARSCNLIEEASKVGRVDVFVQSTDKNFMVPVGGAIIAGFDASVIEQIAESYPGRASCTPSMDLLITLLSMGETGYRVLIKQREANYKKLLTTMDCLAKRHGERMLDTRHNPISLAMTITQQNGDSNLSPKSITRLGSMLFTRNCSGARVVVPKQVASIDQYEFVGWGSHCAAYPFAYLNVAAAIGMGEEEINRFIEILDNTLSEFRKKDSQKGRLSCNGFKADDENHSSVRNGINGKDKL